MRRPIEKARIRGVRRFLIHGLDPLGLDVLRPRRPRPSLLTIWKGCINDSFFGFEFLMEKN